MRTPSVFQPAQDRDRAVEVADQHAFGDFELEPRRRQAGLQQHLVHQLRQVAVLELHRRQIDGDVAAAAAMTPPRGRRCAAPIRRAR